MKKSFITLGPGCEDDQLLASLVMSKHFYLFVLMLYVPVNNFQSCRLHVVTNPCHTGLNQYQAEDKVSFSRTQHSDSGESLSSDPSTFCLTLYQLSHCTLHRWK